MLQYIALRQARISYQPCTEGSRPGGTSAGRLRATFVPVRLSNPGDTAYTNDTVDIVLRHNNTLSSKAYTGSYPDPTHPYLSPVYGDYSKGFPPTILVSGTRDLLLSGTVRLHRAMLRGGIKAELHVWEAMPHAPFIGAPEEDEF
jgi:monoterpene epsilon-lactone hydrolase